MNIIEVNEHCCDGVINYLHIWVLENGDRNDTYYVIIVIYLWISLYFVSF